MATTDVLRPKGTKNAWTWEVVEKDINLTDEVAAGVTDHIIFSMAAGAHTQDEHVDEVMVHLENPAGDGRTVTVNVTNGVSTIQVAITGTEDVFGSSTTNNFDWDVSAQALTIQFTTSAGTTAGRMAVHIAKHDVVIA